LVSILLMLDFTMTASGWTNRCPRKPGAAQWVHGLANGMTRTSWSGYSFRQAQREFDA
jgi:hypothetical protein